MCSLAIAALCSRGSPSCCNSLLKSAAETPYRADDVKINSRAATMAFASFSSPERRTNNNEKRTKRGGKKGERQIVVKLINQLLIDTSIVVKMKLIEIKADFCA